LKLLLGKPEIKKEEPGEGEMAGEKARDAYDPEEPVQEASMEQLQADYARVFGDHRPLEEDLGEAARAEAPEVDKDEL